ncbi:hypothetical protein MOQ_001273 [Trypanosoma cruzi marinkellei]|uniref:Uncharacterized protein n=1 Tax=Trypanosoma cruzi marinkellei TaxID=85056 RepID=K2NL80_TRYCR|nr:hypothetical protein MOQ_001273 [Trypanosoma cruzi marinkellei]
MDSPSREEAVETLLRTCSRGGNREDVARLLLLQQIAGERVDDVAGELDGASIVDEVLFHGEGHGTTLPCITPPPPFTIRAKELWEAFPSWCRDTELQRRQCGGDAVHGHSFVCCAWNLGCVAGVLSFPSAHGWTAAYRSPWSHRYQLPLVTRDGGGGDNNNDDDNDGDSGMCCITSLEEEVNAIEEAQKEGRVMGTLDYGEPTAVIMELEQRLNHTLEKYGAQYFYTSSGAAGKEMEVRCASPWATSAFVRNLSSAEGATSGFVTLEVIALECVDIAEKEQPVQAASSLFDGDEIWVKGGREKNECSSFPGMTNTFSSVGRRRWSAGHSFQLRLNPTELLIRHDTAYLIVNPKYHGDSNVGNAANESSRMWLFHKNQGRPETLPFPRRTCRNHDLVKTLERGDEKWPAFLEHLDLDALVCLLCARVEKSDNAVVPLGVSPIVRVTLPLVAPSPGRMWEKALQKSSTAVAAAAVGVAEMVRNRSGRG